jgi:hypothetical protein
MLQRDIIGVSDVDAFMGVALLSRVLQSLPPELSLLILGQLELKDILHCGLVSKRWRALSNEQSESESHSSISSLIAS